MGHGFFLSGSFETCMGHRFFFCLVPLLFFVFFYDPQAFIPRPIHTFPAQRFTTHSLSLLVFPGPFKQRKYGEHGPGWLLQFSAFSIKFQTLTDKYTVSRRYTTTIKASSKSCFKAGPPEILLRSKKKANFTFREVKQF
jgi:hypothetical protein